MNYNTLDYSNKCFKKLRSLYIVSNYKRYQTDEFQPASENRQRCGGSDVFGMLVPDLMQICLATIGF